MVTNVHSYLNLFLQIYLIKVTQTLTCFFDPPLPSNSTFKNADLPITCTLASYILFPRCDSFWVCVANSIVISPKEALMADICSDSNVMGPSVLLDQILSALLTCW